jgi:serpin B
MTDMFTGGLEGIGLGLQVSDVIQKALIEVDEKGTVAAAATAIMTTNESYNPVQVIQFEADHPFLFYLRDQVSGMLLFQGRVADPRASASG